MTSEITFDQIDGKWTVISSKLTVHGHVHGLDAAKFREMAAAAKDGCPISRALAANVQLSVEASLDCHQPARVFRVCAGEGAPTIASRLLISSYG